MITVTSLIDGEVDVVTEFNSRLEAKYYAEYLAEEYEAIGETFTVHIDGTLVHESR